MTRPPARPALPALALLAGLSAGPAAAQRLEVVSPTDGGLALGGAVVVEVKGAPTPPDAVRLDGAALRPRWEALPYPGRWVAVLPLGSAGRHALEVERRARIGPLVLRVRDRVDFSNAVGGSVEVGDLVAGRSIDRRDPARLAWQWAPAVLLYGLERFAAASPRRADYVDFVRRYHAHHAAAGLRRIDHPDVCASALSALGLARAHGDPVGLGAADEVAAYLRREPRNALGAIDHLGANSRLRRWALRSGLLTPLLGRPPFPYHWAHSIWVDSLVMYALVAVRYGDDRGDPALFEFGLRQPGIFAGVLQDPATGLLGHAWDVPAGRRIGATWLRGNGWVGAAVVDMLERVPPGHPRRPELERVLRDLARGLLARQLPSGLWDTYVDRPGAGYPEASGSALAAYALAKGARQGVLPPAARAAARRTFRALTSRLRERPNGYAVCGTSVATSAFPPRVYRLIPRRCDVDYGEGAFLLLAGELAGETW